MTSDVLETPALRHARSAEPDPERLDGFLGKMIGDLGAAVSASLVLIGDHLGL